KRAVLTAATVACAGLLVPWAHGTDKTWTNGSADSNWGTSSNWSPSGVPGSVDTVIFGNTGNGGVNLGSVTRTVDTVRFTNTTGYYSISNGPIVVNHVQDGGGGAQFATPLSAGGSTMSIDVTGVGDSSFANGISATNINVTTTSAVKAVVWGPNSISGTVNLTGKL